MPCTCDTPSQSFITLNQIAAPTRQTWRNEEWLAVPVIMAIDGVEMKGAVIPTEEFFAPSWNGVPVTFGHPADANGDFLTANTPETLDAYSVGYIFGTVFTGGKLKAEAWVNIAQAEVLREGSIEALESGGLKIDVSTGYFAQHTQGDGVILHGNIKPDHLAILFDIAGACSIADGCGVRANQNRGKPMPKKTVLAAALATINSALGVGAGKVEADTSEESEFSKKLTIEANRRGSSDDFRQMVADLVSSDDSPFVPEDMYGLMDLSTETTKMLRNQYVQGFMETNEEAGTEPVATTTSTVATTTLESGDLNQQEGQTMPEQNTVPVVVPETKGAGVTLNEADQAALEFARNQFEEHRKALVARITGNSEMKAEQLEAMSVAMLQTVADGLRPAANYGVRAANQPLAAHESENEAESTKSMQAPDVFASMNTKAGA